MNRRISLLVVACLCCPATLLADFRYDETTKITGGSLMSMMKFAGAFSRSARQLNDPITNSVYIKGNRMARVGKDYGEIVDLDSETVTHIDHQKKQYYTVTFQEMKQQLEEAQRKAESEAAKQKAEAKQTPSDPDTDVKFDVNVRNTGATKEYSGLNTSESILNVQMQGTNRKTGEKGNLSMNNDMWMAPEIPGYKEVRDFYIRYSQKMGQIYSGAFASSLAAVQPGSLKGMAEMSKEVSKLKGVPIYSVMRMGSTQDGSPLPAASEAPLPADNGPAMPTAKEVAQESAASAMASKLGGLGGMMGGFGRKKKQQQEQTQKQEGDAKGGTQNVAVLMEATSEMSGFSTAPIDTAVFQPPANYKKVDAPRARGSQE